MHIGIPIPKMICRHSPGDPNCSKQSSWKYQIPSASAPVLTPDASNYVILDAEQVGHHLVLKVRYPNCVKCAFEGIKIMIFLECTSVRALKWKRIDPHFRDPNSKGVLTDAPSPDARFPGTDEGWKSALDYAQYCCEKE